MNSLDITQYSKQNIQELSNSYGFEVCILYYAQQQKLPPDVSETLVSLRDMYQTLKEELISHYGEQFILDLF